MCDNMSRCILWHRGSAVRSGLQGTWGRDQPKQAADCRGGVLQIAAIRSLWCVIVFEHFGVIAPDSSHSHSKTNPTCSIVCAQRPGVDGWVSVIGEVCIWPLAWSPRSLGKMWHQYTILYNSMANYTGICYIVRAALTVRRWDENDW